MTDYEPELGQGLFGQPWKRYQAPELLISALRSIDDELDMVMWNIHQKQYESPFGNTGNSFKEIEEFQVEAYSWNDEYEQPWNFKWKDFEVSWYKHLRRATSINREIDTKEIAELLIACVEAIRKYGNDNGVWDDIP